jgi:hypothetical protein
MTLLQKFGTAGVFGLISASMLIVVLSIGIDPRPNSPMSS